jgi:hypothetical protein
MFVIIGTLSDSITREMDERNGMTVLAELSNNNIKAFLDFVGCRESFGIVLKSELREDFESFVKF